MAQLTKAQKKKILSIILVIILAIASYVMTQIEENEKNEVAQGLTDTLAVHYINADQGDAIFIELPQKRTMLIDASTNSQEQTVIDYIAELGYKEIDYVIATHPHEDHIGGMDGVLNTFPVKNFYLPEDTATTKTFEKMLDALELNGAEVFKAEAGVEIINEEGLEMTVLSPIAEYAEEYGDDHNAWSVVCKLTYGNNSFLFTGDAEKESELLIEGDISADVLKAGHHGSSTSSCEEFMGRVNPKIVVISCGVDNDYGHPHWEAMSRFENANAKIYRTDEQGTVTVTSDGKIIDVKTEY